MPTRSPRPRAKIDIGIVGDCKAVLRQLIEASGKRVNADRFSAWRRTLADGETAKRQAPGANKPLDDMPIHPLRLCDEIKNFMQRDAILVVDGQEILNFGRQSMPTFVPWPSPQFRTVRHYGRRVAVRHRRQDRQAR